MEIYFNEMENQNTFSLVKLTLSIQMEGDQKTTEKFLSIIKKTQIGCKGLIEKSGYISVQV